MASRLSSDGSLSLSVPLLDSLWCSYIVLDFSSAIFFFNSNIMSSMLILDTVDNYDSDYYNWENFLSKLIETGF